MTTTAAPGPCQRYADENPEYADGKNARDDGEIHGRSNDRSAGFARTQYVSRRSKLRCFA